MLFRRIPLPNLRKGLSNSLWKSWEPWEKATVQWTSQAVHWSSQNMVRVHLPARANLRLLLQLTQSYSALEPLEGGTVKFPELNRRKVLDPLLKNYKYSWNILICLWMPFFSAFLSSKRHSRSCINILHRLLGPWPRISWFWIIFALWTPWFVSNLTILWLSKSSNFSDSSWHLSNTW